MIARTRHPSSPIDLDSVLAWCWIVALVALVSTARISARDARQANPQLGRLVLIQAPGAVVPTAFEFVSPVGLVVTSVLLPASLRITVDVPQDEVLRVRAVYAGGLRGQTITLPRPLSGEVTVPVENVGALNLEVEEPFCGANSTEVIRLTLVDRKSDNEPIVWTGDLNACSHAISGIPPGQYALESIPSRGDILAVERRLLTVSAQQRTDIVVRTPEAYLQGVVLVNYLEVDEGLLLVRSGQDKAYVSTDRLGRFSTEIKDRTDFQITLLADGQERIVAKGRGALGRNTIRVNALIPTIRLSFPTELRRRMGVTTVFVEGTDRTSTYRPGDGDSTLVIPDLPLGEYRVWATGPSGSSDRYHSVSLSEQNPVAEIDVTFARQERVATIFDSDGTPVREAHVNFGLGTQSMTTLASGAFDLSAWPVGIPLTVTAQGSSRCYRITNEASQRILLRRTRPIELQFLNRSGARPATRAIGTFVSPGGCRSDLNRLPFTVLRDDDEAFTLLVQVPDDVEAFVDRDGTVYHITKNIASILLR